MNTDAPVKAPVRTESPDEMPKRRLHPREICGPQKETIVRRIREV